MADREISLLARPKGLPFLIEQPEPWGPDDPNATLFDFPQMLQLMQMEGVETLNFDQCMHGAATKKTNAACLLQVGPVFSRRAMLPPVDLFQQTRGQRSAHLDVATSVSYHRLIPPEKEWAMAHRRARRLAQPT